MAGLTFPPGVAPVMPNNTAQNAQQGNTNIQQGVQHNNGQQNAGQKSSAQHINGNQQPNGAQHPHRVQQGNGNIQSPQQNTGAHRQGNGQHMNNGIRRTHNGDQANGNLQNAPQVNANRQNNGVQNGARQNTGSPQINAAQQGNFQYQNGRQMGQIPQTVQGHVQAPRGPTMTPPVGQQRNPNGQAQPARPQTTTPAIGQQQSLLGQAQATRHQNTPVTSQGNDQNQQSQMHGKPNHNGQPARSNALNQEQLRQAIHYQNVMAQVNAGAQQQQQVNMPANNSRPAQIHHTQNATGFGTPVQQPQPAVVFSGANNTTQQGLHGSNAMAQQHVQPVAYPNTAAHNSAITAHPSPQQKAAASIMSMEQHLNKMKSGNNVGNTIASAVPQTQMGNNMHVQQFNMNGVAGLPTMRDIMQNHVPDLLQKQKRPGIPAMNSPTINNSGASNNSKSSSSVSNASQQKAPIQRVTPPGQHTRVNSQKVCFPQQSPSLSNDDPFTGFDGNASNRRSKRKAEATPEDPNKRTAVADDNDQPAPATISQEDSKIIVACARSIWMTLMEIKGSMIKNRKIFGQGIAFAYSISQTPHGLSADHRADMVKMFNGLVYSSLVVRGLHGFHVTPLPTFEDDEKYEPTQVFLPGSSVAVYVSPSQISPDFRFQPLNIKQATTTNNTTPTPSEPEPAKGRKVAAKGRTKKQGSVCIPAVGQTENGASVVTLETGAQVPIAGISKNQQKKAARQAKAAKMSPEACAVAAAMQAGDTDLVRKLAAEKEAKDERAGIPPPSTAPRLNKKQEEALAEGRRRRELGLATKPRDIRGQSVSSSNAGTPTTVAFSVNSAIGNGSNGHTNANQASHASGLAHPNMGGQQQPFTFPVQTGQMDQVQQFGNPAVATGLGITQKENQQPAPVSFEDLMKTSGVETSNKQQSQVAHTTQGQTEQVPPQKPFDPLDMPPLENTFDGIDLTGLDASAMNFDWNDFGGFNMQPVDNGGQQQQAPEQPEAQTTADSANTDSAKVIDVEGLTFKPINSNEQQQEVQPAACSANTDNINGIPMTPIVDSGNTSNNQVQEQASALDMYGIPMMEINNSYAASNNQVPAQPHVAANGGKMVHVDNIQSLNGMRVAKGQVETNGYGKQDLETFMTREAKDSLGLFVPQATSTDQSEEEEPDARDDNDSLFGDVDKADESESTTNAEFMAFMAEIDDFNNSPQGRLLPQLDGAADFEPLRTDDEVRRDHELYRKQLARAEEAAAEQRRRDSERNKNLAANRDLPSQAERERRAMRKRLHDRLAELKCYVVKDAKSYRGIEGREDELADELREIEEIEGKIVKLGDKVLSDKEYEEVWADPLGYRVEEHWIPEIKGYGEM
ncbi:hypothetical protein GE09DRAFT_1064823 [Coniochaeta sp. 2T2.1]|nr:hypothetical protein GE09DRAFT_1064823 [Coniochaeta sp. 2T2.1]